MSHVDDGLLAGYADGALSAVEKNGVDAHLTGCAACRAALEEARRLAARSHEILAGAAPAFSPPPTFDELAARSRGSAERKGLEGMSKLAWAASLALAIGLGWYARGIVMQPGEDFSLTPARPALTPGPSPLRGEGGAPRDRATSQRGEGNGSRDRLASRQGDSGAERGRPAKVSGDRPERDAKAEGILRVPASQVIVTGVAPGQRSSLDSTRVDALADMSKSTAGAGAGAAGGVVPPQARAPATLQLQATPTRLAREMEPHVFTVAGLDIVRRGVITPGSDAVRTIQLIDAAHDLELVQEPLGAELRRSRLFDSTRAKPDSIASVTVERDGYRITGRAAVPVDSLRALLNKLH